MRKLILCAIAFGACRDLTLPPGPTGADPGSVFGRAVYRTLGLSTPQPAANALVTLGESTLSIRTATDGHFNLEGLMREGGQLTIQFDSDGDGAFDRSRTVSLDEVGAGPGRHISLGDVEVGQSARLHGLVLREELRGVSGGHAGTQVFVPLTALTTYSANDGTYQLDGIPAGRVSLGFFRAGYLPATLDGLTLQPAENFNVSDVLLARDDGSQHGTLSGTVTSSPSTAPAGATVTVTSASTGMTMSTQTDTTGAFSFASLSIGLYDVSVTREGYTPLVVPNVLVFNAQTTTLSLTMGQGGQTLDGGRPPPPDAGPLLVCTLNEDCGPGNWCDRGFCSPQCGATQGCSEGRVCDAASHTCVQPCTGACPTGQTCDVATRTCRALCDMSIACATGFKCSSNVCVPECATAMDCPSTHQTCQAGQCTPDGTCGNDLDCLLSQVCILSTCVARRVPDGGALTDAGWPCAAACDCRQGERCAVGFCQPDSLPTLLLSAVDGGDLISALAAAHAGDVIALRAGDTFYSNDAFAVATAGVTLSGGYVSCGSTRWVYDDTKKTTLVVDGGTALRVPGTASNPLSDVVVRGLTLRPVWYPGNCTEVYAFSASVADRLLVKDTEANFFGPVCGDFNKMVFHVLGSNDVTLTQLRMLPGQVIGEEQGLWLESSSGHVSGFTTPNVDQNGPYTPVVVTKQTGPVRLEKLALGLNLQYFTTGISAGQCGANPLEISDSTIALHTAGISVGACAAVSLHDLFIDGTSNTQNVNVTGIDLANSAGTMKNVHVTLASANGNLDVVAMHGPGAWSVDGLDVDGCASSQNGAVLHVTTGSGPVSASHVYAGRADAGVLGNCGIYGLIANAATSVLLTDSEFRMPVGAVSVTGGAARVERITAVSGQPLGLANVSPFESYSSFFYATATATAAWEISYSQVYGDNNTIDGAGLPSAASLGVHCGGPSTLVMTSNLISGGQGNASLILSEYAGPTMCFVPANWDHNYFYAPSFAALAPSDSVSALVPVDGGVDVTNGNLYGARTGCYPFNSSAPSAVLSPGSPCKDKGKAGKRPDNTTVEYDITGADAGRQKGAGVDIGAFELD